MKFAAALVGAVIVLSGCEAIEDKTDYHRHTMSSIRESRTEQGIIVFEATTSTLYPADSDAAEQARIGWLEAWMKRLNFCPYGYEILSRDKIDPGEVNVQRHDLRYRVQCSGVAPEPD